MDKLIRDGRVIRGYIGIGGREIAPLHAQQGSGMDPIQGIVVNEVTPNGPAALAGIQVNDLIISVNNKPAVSALEDDGSGGGNSPGLRHSGRGNAG
ncbi:serine endoprotease [Salmonella enterica subsp. enterica]|uniref:Serine endoprotease n=1 Tax=Salmonella enterica I TaxID=59201 RepID=A0A379W3I7_SALET|nr:serine endoprotease [Salmonella enterica subsp. enterica]